MCLSIAGLPNLQHCMFVRYDNMETRCVENTTNIAAVNNLIEGAKFEELLESNFDDQCSKESEIKPTQIPPKFSTDLVNDTTTSTTSSTSTSTTTKSTSSSTTTVR